MARKRARSSDSSSSDDDVPEPKKGPIKAISKAILDSSDSSSSSSDDDGEWNAKPKAKAKPKRGKPVKKPAPKTVKRKLKTSESEESDSSEDDEPKSARKRLEEKEEGEVEDFSDNDDEDIEEFNDGFDENLMGDEEDQRKLSLMTEKEREQELFNRSEKREVLKTRFEIERKLRLAKKQDMKKKVTEKDKGKEKSDKEYAASLAESSSRSVERRRNIEDKSKVKDAIKGLKAEREKKKLKQKLRAADVYSDSSDSDSNSDAKPSKKSTKPRSSSSDSSSSSSISDDDSDTDVKAKSGSDRRRGDDKDWEKGRTSDGEAEQFNFSLEHLNTIRLSRFKMEKWCHAPFFKDTVTGCFVRIGIGHTSQTPAYIVGQIVDVIDNPKVYLLGKTRTNKVIKLKHAKNPERLYRLEYISNSEFSTQEYDKWYTKMVADYCDFPSRDFVDRKKADIQKAVNYQFSDADVEQIVAEKGKFKDMPVNFAMKKSQLMKDKDYAQLNGDHERAMDLTREIDRLEDEAKRRDKVRTQNIAAISFINERNRMRNIKEAERAIAESQTSAEVKDDPFTRRKCAPMMISQFGKKGDAPLPPGGDDASQRSSTEQSKPDAKDLTDSATVKSTLPSLNNGTKSGKSATKTAGQDSDDLFNAHDFDIKIDFELPLSSNSSSSNTNFSSGFLSGLSNGKSANGFADTRPNSLASSGANRRSLNLDEYKKKKGLI